MSLFALLLTWTVGFCVVAAMRRRHTHPLALLGSGFLMGQTLIMAALYASLVLSGSGNAKLMLVLLTVLLLFVATAASRAQTKDVGVQVMRSKMTFGGSILIIAIILVLAIKLAVIAVSTWSVPIRGDDAISIWLFRAKVISGLDQMPLDPSSPYFRGGSNPSYPVFGSLMAAWLPMASHGWTERCAVMAWPVFYLSLILLAAGGLRRWLHAPASWLAAYMIASVPLMLIHVVRPGYLDLPLAAFLAGATLHLLWWRQDGSIADFIIGTIFALAAACMKREGPALAAILLVGFLLTSPATIRMISTKGKMAIAGSMTIAVALCAMLTDWSPQAAAISDLGYYPGVLPALIRHCFEWSSLNLFFYVAIAALVAVTIRRDSAHALTTCLICLGLISFVAGVFLFTPQGRFALNDQTPSRLFLQIIPAMILLLAGSLARPRPAT